MMVMEQKLINIVLQDWFSPLQPEGPNFCINIVDSIFRSPVPGRGEHHTEARLVPAGAAPQAKGSTALHRGDGGEHQGEVL